MLTKKEKFMCLLLSIAINLVIIWAYGKFVKPQIDQAAKGMAILITH